MSTQTLWSRALRLAVGPYFNICSTLCAPEQVRPENTDNLLEMIEMLYYGRRKGSDSELMKYAPRAANPALPSLQSITRGAAPLNFTVAQFMMLLWKSAVCAQTDRFYVNHKNFKHTTYIFFTEHKVFCIKILNKWRSKIQHISSMDCFSIDFVHP